MSYKWKRDYSLGQGQLDAEWTSFDKAMRIIAVPDTRSPPERKNYKIRVQCNIDYPEADTGYRKLSDRKLESFLSLYLLQFGQGANDIDIISPDELLNKEELMKAGIPLPVFPTDSITIYLQSKFEASKLDDTYNLLHEIESKSNVDDLKNILYWHREACNSEDSVYSFMFMWIALEGVSSIKYHEVHAARPRPTSQMPPPIADTLECLFANLFDANEAQHFMTGPGFPQNLTYVFKHSQGRYCNSPRARTRQDYVLGLENAMKTPRFEKALEFLWRCVYGVRKEIFHAGQRFRDNPSYLGTYNFFLRELLRESLLKYIS